MYTLLKKFSHYLVEYDNKTYMIKIVEVYITSKLVKYIGKQLSWTYDEVVRHSCQQLLHV